MVEQVVQGDQEAEEAQEVLEMTREHQLEVLVEMGLLEEAEQELMLRGVQEVQVVMVLVLPVVHFQEIMAALVVKHGATTQQVVDADSVVVVEVMMGVIMMEVEVEVEVEVHCC